VANLFFFLLLSHYIGCGKMHLSVNSVVSHNIAKLMICKMLMMYFQKKSYDVCANAMIMLKIEVCFSSVKNKNVLI